MLVLLDTTVAAGVVSYLDPQQKDNGGQKGQNWLDCVKQLTVNIEAPTVAIPTPAFYELASRDGKMFEALKTVCNDPQRHSIFHYCNYSITPRILLAAARLRSRTKNKGSMIDAILGAYCLVHGYWIATTNQKDFPQRFFEVKAMTLAPLPQDKTERTVIFLLAPELEKWAAD